MRAFLTAAVFGLGVFIAAPSALAATSASSNWAGYAVHRPGVSFREVTGTWREPALTCHRGRASFSSYWVGLGGFNRNAHALEQTGTEVDCLRSGRIRTFAWYESIPAPSVRVALSVPPGDQIQGQVVATGHEIRLTLRDLTRHELFSKLLQVGPVDVSSAEWIVEAPSDCLSATSCATLPLGNFGVAGFEATSAESVAGHVGSISDPGWSATPIKLVPSSRSTYVMNGSLSVGGEATPSPLQAGGTGFTVAYVPRMVHGARTRSGTVLAVSRLMHPGR